MASGMPDYQNTVRPKFGGAILADGSEAVVANVVTPLVQKTGKGMIYAGSVWMDYTSSQGNSEVWLRIDEFYVPALSFARMKDFGVTDPRKAIVSLNKYDTTNYIYSVGLSYGITFETGFILAYSEEHGTTPTVHYRLVYALY